MKRVFMLAAAFAFVGGMAMADVVDDAIQSLTDSGVTVTEVNRGTSTTKIEGTDANGNKVEVTVDNTTGEVLKQETEAADGTTVSEDESTDDDSSDDSGDDGSDDGSDDGGSDDNGGDGGGDNGGDGGGDGGSDD